MRTLQQGNTGKDVTQLQEALNEKGYTVAVDGKFGKKTHEAVCRFQQDAGLVVDGIVGPKTWDALQQSQPSIDFEQGAQTLNIDVAAIRAVHQVESAGRSGFLPDGRPEILFEGHIFWGQLKKAGITPEIHQPENSDILFPEWDKSSYKGGTKEYPRLIRACLIHFESALKSASWGMFQIMGFNHQYCGYDTVFEYVSAMQQSQDKQFQAFIQFIQNNGLDTLLRDHDWAEFARLYNGERYRENQYDEKLQMSYYLHIIHNDGMAQ
ncbi:MAG: N-acetylmuramidase family protein [Bacteroidetes bacterium]|nr:N-acetylmuramidase family protein [Bacteroidota bacterium]